jgi:hypothetical protein
MDRRSVRDMNSTETGSHPYPFDADAFAVGQDHGKRNRYSLSQSTGPAWVYWYGEGRVQTAANCVR